MLFPLAEVSIDTILDPEKPGAKDLLAAPLTLPVVAVVTIALALVFAWLVAKLWPRPRVRAFERGDFGVGELDLALLVPLAVVFMALAGILLGGITSMLEPQAIKDAHLAAQEANLTGSAYHAAIEAARAKLSDADIAASAFADHAGKIASALGLILYVPLMLYILRDKRSRLQQETQEPHVARSTLHFAAAKGSILRVFVPFMIWVPLAYALIWLSVAILAVVHPETLDPNHTFNTQPVLKRLMTPSALQWPAAILSAVVAAPLFEEFVFRGVIQGTLRRFMPFPIAVLIPVILFTAVHEIWASPQILVPVAGLGIALGWVYERTGNIWHAVMLHALHNGATLVLASSFGKS